MRRPLPVLVLAGMLLLAGCVGLDTHGTPTATPTDVHSATASASTTVPTTDDGYYRSYEISAHPTSPEAIVRATTISRAGMVDELLWRTDRFVTPLFANGTAIRVDVSDEPDPEPGPFANGTLVREDGTVYALDKQVVSRREARGYRMTLKGPLGPDHVEYDRATREAVRFETLASADRGVVTYAVPAPDEREAALVTAGYTYVFPSATDAANATLVDGARHYVRYDGDLYRIRADDRVDGAVRYEVEYDRRRVADSVADLFEQRRDSMVTPLTPGTADPVAYELAVDVIGGERAAWAGSGPAPTRFQVTGEWVQNHPPDGRRAYVRYESDLYELRVEKVVE